ncbi:hypothetical protein LXL04_038053 [Taraxacum kok-saghyz]
MTSSTAGKRYRVIVLHEAEVRGSTPGSCNVWGFSPEQWPDQVGINLGFLREVGCSIPTGSDASGTKTSINSAVSKKKNQNLYYQRSILERPAKRKKRSWMDVDQLRRGVSFFLKQYPKNLHGKLKEVFSETISFNHSQSFSFTISKPMLRTTIQA